MKTKQGNAQVGDKVALFGVAGQVIATEDEQLCLVRSGDGLVVRCEQQALKIIAPVAQLPKVDHAVELLKGCSAKVTGLDPQVAPPGARSELFTRKLGKACTILQAFRTTDGKIWCSVLQSDHVHAKYWLCELTLQANDLIYA